MLIPLRIPNYDLATAYDLLTTGTYQRLPTVLKVDPVCLSCSINLTIAFQSSFAAPEKLPSSAVLDILRETNEAIRYRLAVTDVLPDEMRTYNISQSSSWKSQHRDVSHSDLCSKWSCTRHRSRSLRSLAYSGRERCCRSMASFKHGIPR